MTETAKRFCRECGRAVPPGERYRYCPRGPDDVSCRNRAKRKRTKVHAERVAAFAEGRELRDRMVPLEALAARGTGANCRRRGWAERELEMYQAAIRLHRKIQAEIDSAAEQPEGERSGQAR